MRKWLAGFAFAFMLIGWQGWQREDDASTGTALHLAAAFNSRAAIALLDNLGANLEARNTNGRTPLYVAAKRGRLEAVKALLDRGANPNSYNADVRFSPLHVAAEYYHLKVIRELLARGANPNQTNRYVQTPLWQAAWQSHRDGAVARVLVAAGAKMEVGDHDGTTPLSHAVDNGHTVFAKTLLELGANPDAQSLGGWAPLHHAAQRNDQELTLALLEAGANPDVATDAGYTPLHEAAARGYVEIAELLLDFGAAIEAETKFGDTALQLAASNRHRAFATYLDVRGAKR